MCGVHRGDEGITSDENVITYRESRTLVPSHTLVSDEWNRHLSVGYISHISDSPRHSFISTCFAYESSIFFCVSIIFIYHCWSFKHSIRFMSLT